MDELLKALIGRKIQAVFISEEHLILRTEDVDIWVGLDADCCSRSYFYDFIGANKIIGRKVVSVEEIELDIKNTDIVKEKTDYGWVFMKDNKEEDAEIEAYGIKITVEDEIYGELTGVFSFRNASNGCYGGSIGNVKSIPKGSEPLPKGSTQVWDNFTF